MLIIPLIETTGGAGKALISNVLERPQFAVPPPPSFRSSGTTTSGVGAITPPYPTDVAEDDICILFGHSGNEAMTLSDAQGFVEAVAQTGTGVAAAAGSTRFSIWWKRYNAAETTAPTMADSGDHTLGKIFAFPGCVRIGSPFDVIGTADTAASDTAVSIPGLTTTRANTLIVAICADGIDSAGGRFTSAANSSLTNVTESGDFGTGQSNGGGIVVVTGIKATVGVVAATTGTLSSASVQARISLALRGY